MTVFEMDEQSQANKCTVGPPFLPVGKLNNFLVKCSERGGCYLQGGALPIHDVIAKFPILLKIHDEKITTNSFLAMSVEKKSCVNNNVR